MFLLYVSNLSYCTQHSFPFVVDLWCSNHFLIKMLRGFSLTHLKTNSVLLDPEVSKNLLDPHIDDYFNVAVNQYTPFSVVDFN